MKKKMYDVSVAAINQHIKRVYDDSELEPTIKKYLIVQKGGSRKVSREVAHLFMSYFDKYMLELEENAKK